MAIVSCEFREDRRQEFIATDWLETSLAARGVPVAGELQGIGDTWQGYNCFFRFRFEAGTFGSYLVKNGFHKADFTSVEYRFKLPLGMRKHFTPPWQPTLQPKSEIYIKEFRDASSTVVLLQHTDGYAFVHSSGDVIPKRAN